MKRSELNKIMRDAVLFVGDMKFQLPPFAFWSPEDWATTIGLQRPRSSP